MYKVIEQYEPKFRRRDSRYPLTNFRAFLADQGLAPATVSAYLAGLRRLLGHLGEGVAGPDGQTKKRSWEDEAAVEAYRAGLPRGLFGVFQGVWKYWQAYNGRADPTAALSDRTLKSIVAASLRTLLHFRGDMKGVPNFEIDDIPAFVWEYDVVEQRWYISRNGGSTRHTLGPGTRVLGDVIRKWGWPSGKVPPSAPFLPIQPNDFTPMPIFRIRALLDNAIPFAAAKWLNARLAADYEQAVSAALQTDQLFVPPDYVEAPGQVLKGVRHGTGGDRSVVAVDEELGEIRVVDGKLVVEHPEDDGLPDWA